MVMSAYDQRYNLSDEEIYEVDSSLAQSQYVEQIMNDPLQRNTLPLFQDCPVTMESLRLLPFILVLEKQNSKSLYWEMFRMFEHWKKHYGKRAVVFPQTPLVEYDKVYDDFGIEPEAKFFDQADVISTKKMARALSIICKGCAKLSAIKENSLLANEWQAFHLWKKWTDSCDTASRVIPPSLRVLLMLHHVSHHSIRLCSCRSLTF